jgi:hypothetical protein
MSKTSESTSPLRSRARATPLPLEALRLTWSDDKTGIDALQARNS